MNRLRAAGSAAQGGRQSAAQGGFGGAAPGGRQSAAQGGIQSSAPRVSAPSTVLYSMHDMPASTGARLRRKPGGGQVGKMTASVARFKRKAMNKAERHRLIQTVIMQRDVATQRELVHALDSLGCIVTQATISRDIRELDLQKVRTHLGRAKYVLSSRERPKDPEQAAGHVLRDFARSTAIAQNMVVVRCEIGTASTVARQIDNLNHSDVVGTLAGDDTFLIILKDADTAAEMQRYVDRLREA